MSQVFKDMDYFFLSASFCRLEPNRVCLSVWGATSGECLFLSHLQMDYTLKLWPSVALLLLDSA